MLGARFVDAAAEPQALVSRQPQHLAQVADHAGQPTVARQPLDGLVDPVVGFVVRVDLPGARVAGQLVVQDLQRVEVGLGDVACGLVGAAPFEQRHQRKDLVKVLLRQCVDEAAAARLEPHQPFGDQYLERLAQRCAGNAQRGGEGHFVDPGIRHQHVMVDHGPQAIGNLEVQGLLDDPHGMPRQVWKRLKRRNNA